MESLSSSTSGIEADNHDQRPTKIVKTDNTNDPQQQMDILSPRLKLDNHQLISLSNSNVGDGRHAQIANVAKTNRLVVKPNVQVQIGYQRSNQRKATPTNNYNLLISGDHTIAERWRRQKLMQKFIALSALIPGLKKMDKASVLGEAARYMKHLQERVRILEDKVKQQNVKSVLLKKSRVICIDDEEEQDDEDVNSSSENSSDSFSHEDATLPEIQVKMMNKEVLLAIHCEKEQGLLGRILNEMENLHFCVTHTSCMPFGNFDLVITLTAELRGELSTSPEELVHKLRTLSMSKTVTLISEN